MNSDETSTSSPVRQLVARQWSNWLAAVSLFLATALVVIWQNSRLAVLWDLSYTLENSYRISLGDIPYRDFPFAHAPLTFLIQAAIIKLAGRAVWHHAAYCAIIGGLSTVLTWRIIQSVLRPAVTHARLIAFVLSLPLIPLGIYCVFPHPFYDPDCTFAILLSIFLLQQLDLKPASVVRALLAGIALVMPLFVKQNTGLAYLTAAAVLLIVMIAVERWRHRPVRGYVLTLGAAAVSLAVAVMLIQFTAGFRNYWHWTIQFAAQRRTPALAEMLGIYADKTILLWLALIVLGFICLWFKGRGGRARSRVWTLLSAVLISAPFVWPAIYLLREHDSSERADRLLGVWPVLLIFSFVVAIVAMRRRRGAALVMPFMIIGAIHGAFMSQQLWGSTYAIWPLFMILLAMIVAGLASAPRLDAGVAPQSSPPRLDATLVPQSVGRTSPPSKRSSDRSSWLTISFTIAVALSLLISGGFYVRSHERLDYANLDEGQLRRSTLPQLRGLSVRGDWIPSFEELVRYTEREIPRDEGILLLPGEDPFYYATGRRPQFPVLLFDHTVNPYSPQEILQLARDRNIRWVIIKQDIQDEDEQIEQERDRITEALDQDFEQVESLSNYDIYRRRDPNSQKDDDDDEDK
ncbi:MAG: hypothetical protein QOF72_13 [Blastocatellia bacterium]|jgi:hypothetical protein|nr:hypothetical protein [Blastocatellia bacterium]